MEQDQNMMPLKIRKRKMTSQKRGFSSTKTKDNSTRWANMDDIAEAGLFSDEGVHVGRWEDPHTGQTHYLRHNGPEHVLCIGPARSGKDTCLVIPTLLSWPRSCVVTDLKDELWSLTSGWRKEHAQNTVLRFEPASEHGSISWNPMEEIRLDTVYEIGDAQNLATIIVDPNGHGLEDYWQETAQALLVGCILHLLYKKRNGDIQTASLSSVDAMLADPERPIKDLFLEMVKYGHIDGKPHPVVAQSAQDMIERSDEEAGAVLSTVQSCLAPYRDPIVAANINRSSFFINQLMNLDKPISLYIVTKPLDGERLKPLVRVLISMICRTLSGKAELIARGKYETKMLMLLDEFPRLGKLKVIQESLAFLSGDGIRFYITCQDISQLRSDKNGYGKDEAISSNCHITSAFQPNSLETARHLSRLAGRTRIKKTRKASKYPKKIYRPLSPKRIYRPLLTEDECMRMAPAMLVSFVSFLGIPPIYGKQMPYFLDPVFQARSSIKPPKASDRIIDIQAVDQR